MKSIISIIKILIIVSVVTEVFVLYTVFDNSNKISNGGDIVTFKQDMKTQDMNVLSEGTYVITQKGYVKLNNYWIYDLRVFSISIPLLISLILIIILKNNTREKTL